MPWKEFTAMSQRRELVELLRQGTVSISTMSKRFGVSRKTIYKWLERFELQGTHGLIDQSRRPHGSPIKTPESMEDQVVALRKQHPAWGGRKLRKRLQVLGVQQVPSTSTITEILRRHALLGVPGHRPTQPYQRFEHESPNDLWQMDFKGHVGMGNGRRCHPLTVLDDHSRYALVLQACGNEQAATVQGALIASFRRYGLPKRMLMDNGPPWGEPGLSRWTQLTVWLLRLGVRVSHGRPRHPQTQGKDERFHRTLVTELLGVGMQWADLMAYQHQFDPWREMYNHERPHEAIGLAVPASRYRVSDRVYPETLPVVEYPSSDVVRIVRNGGVIQYRGVVWSLTRAFKDERVAIRPTRVDGVWAVWFAGEMLGEIDEREVKQQSRRVGRVAAPVGLRPPSAATLPIATECT